MLGSHLSVCVYFLATLFAATCILGQQLYRKPWPTYSLQNMPQTQFTCHDKILGGYYADSETQCQMFHVCVKLAGVGVQDFRFLCPNGTAFDQEAQICAYWGDVDCEQSVLYYGSDNFDLYRIGSGFESKRAPLAEEEEATFHLQRAESADIRRSKETRVDQKSNPDQPHNYARDFSSGKATTRNTFNSYANLNANANTHVRNQQQQQERRADATKRPLVNLYTPTTSTTTTTEKYNDESKQDLDDIFKGSHTSHFFANRNGGREDDFLDHPIAKTRKNEFNDFNRKYETSTSGAKLTQLKRLQKSTTSTTTTTTTSAPLPKFSKKVTLQTSYNTGFVDYSQQFKTTTPTTTSTTQRSTTLTTPRPSPASSNANRFSFNSNIYQTQEKIQPTTYNPANSVYYIKATTPKSVESYAPRSRKEPSNTLDKAKSYNKPTISSRKSQKLERTQQKIATQNTTLTKNNELPEFTKLKLQPPQPFQPVQTARTPPAAKQQDPQPQYFRSRALQVEQAKVGNAEPAPFSKPQQRGTASAKTNVKNNIELSPRASSNRGSINYKATTQRQDDFYNPTTSGVKKFSTLVPKEQYTPTTFKPTTYKKTYENNYFVFPQTVRPNNKTPKPFISTSTAPPTTANPYYNVDEDDGQYHPELYEVDFPRNRLNIHRGSSVSASTITSTTTRKPFQYSANLQNPQTHLKTQQQTAFQKQQEQSEPVDLSDEEELFKTAQSLNFGAASINKLRADIIKAEKTSQQYNSQYNPHVVETSSPKTTTVTYTTPTTTATTTKKASSSTTTTPSPVAYTTPEKTKISKGSGKHTKASGSKDKKSGTKSASKRPPHADEDTSYDYAYYDTDTLSESPQEYQEYEIAEFAKTQKH